MKKKNNRKEGPKSKSGPKPSNPFEIKFHKVKHQVLGKKAAKEVLGNPNKKKQKVKTMISLLEICNYAVVRIFV